MKITRKWFSSLWAKVIAKNCNWSKKIVESTREMHHYKVDITFVFKWIDGSQTMMKYVPKIEWGRIIIQARWVVWCPNQWMHTGWKNLTEMGSAEPTLYSINTNNTPYVQRSRYSTSSDNKYPTHPINIQNNLENPNFSLITIASISFHSATMYVGMYSCVHVISSRGAHNTWNWNLGGLHIKIRNGPKPQYSPSSQPQTQLNVHVFDTPKDFICRQIHGMN